MFNLSGGETLWAIFWIGLFSYWTITGVTHHIADHFGRPENSHQKEQTEEQNKDGE